MEQGPLVRRRHLPRLRALAGPRRRRRRDRHPAGRHGQPHRRARQPAEPAGAGVAARRRRGGHQHRHDHPGAHPQQREVGHRDLDPPRHLRVRRPGLGKTKINGVYGQTKEEKRVSLVESGAAPAEAEREGTEAGREALIKTVADLTGVTVDHYAEIGLLGFSLITDALGGVNVCLKEPVYEPLSGADFPAGPQKLNGPQALSFVRQRHELPRGDLDRVVRQQVVMSSLAHQVISGKTLSSPATLNRLQDAIQRSVVLSSGWDIMDFVNQLQKLAAGRVAFATIPVLDESGWSDDGMHSVVRVDPHQVQSWVAGLLQDQAKGKTEELSLRAGQDQRQRRQRHRHQRARRLGVAGVDRQGFGTGKVGNNDAAHVKSSQVQAAKSDDLGAQAVAKELGGLPVVANSSVPQGSVRVVLSSDYTGPGSGLSDGGPKLAAASHPDPGSDAPPPSPILTAGSDHPECVN